MRWQHRDPDRAAVKRDTPCRYRGTALATA